MKKIISFLYFCWYLAKTLLCNCTNVFVLNIFTALLRHKLLARFIDIIEEYKENLYEINKVIVKKLNKEERRTFINFFLKRRGFIADVSKDDLKLMHVVYDKIVSLCPPPPHYLRRSINFFHEDANLALRGFILHKLA